MIDAFSEMKDSYHSEGWECIMCGLCAFPTVFFILLIAGSATYSNVAKENVWNDWKQTECVPYYETIGSDCCIRRRKKRCLEDGKEAGKYMRISLDACYNVTQVQQSEKLECKHESDVGSWPGNNTKSIECWTNCEKWVDKSPKPDYEQAQAMTIASFVIIFCFLCRICFIPPLAFAVLMFIWGTTVFNCGIFALAEPEGCNMIYHAYSSVGYILPIYLLSFTVYHIIFHKFILGCCKDCPVALISLCIATFSSTVLHWLLTFIGIFQLDGVSPSDCFEVDWCGTHVYATMGGPGAWVAAGGALACALPLVYVTVCLPCSLVSKSINSYLPWSKDDNCMELCCSFISCIVSRYVSCAVCLNKYESCIQNRHEKNMILAKEKEDYAIKIAIFEEVDKKWQCAKDAVMPLIEHRDHIWNEIWTLMWDIEFQAFQDGSNLSDFYVAINLWGPLSPVDEHRYDWDTSVQIKTCCNCFKGEILQITTLAQSKGKMDWIIRKNSEIEIPWKLPDAEVYI